jgi:hypothetical protein
MTKLTIALILGAAMCSAGPITYNVNQTVGAGGVTGTIQTDGSTGSLAAGDVLTWDLLINNGSGTFDLTNLNSSVTSNGADLSATATQLSFNFAASDSGYLLFEAPDPFQYFCLETDQICSFNFSGSGVDLALSASDPSTEQFKSVTGPQVVASVSSSPLGTSGPPLGTDDPPTDPIGTPEPSTFSFLGLGIAALGFWKYRAARVNV